MTSGVFGSEGYGRVRVEWVLGCVKARYIRNLRKVRKDLHGYAYAFAILRDIHKLSFGIELANVKNIRSVKGSP